MKKIILHSEPITKKGAKLQFQIKLPNTIKAVTGIAITASKTGKVRGSKDGKPPFTEYAGWLQLQIPEKRDAFYSDLVRFSTHKKQPLGTLPQQELGLSVQNAWWFSGTQHRFFNITIPVERTIIEGYFEDHALNGGQQYTLIIYLETSIK